MITNPASWPCPQSFEDSTSVIALSKSLANPDAAIFALRLWQHRLVYGATVGGPNPRATLEGIAKWRRKAGAFAAAAEACGLVESNADGTLVIRSWEGVAIVATPNAASIPEDREARTRRLNRERQARLRARRSAAAVAADVGNREAR